MMRLTLLITVLLSFTGLAAGWIAFSGGASEEESPQKTDAGTNSPGGEPVEVVHRFALLPADRELDRETPAVAVDSQGRILWAWASKTGASEHTLWLARSADGGLHFDKPMPFRKVPTQSYSSMSKGKSITRSTSVVPRLAASKDVIYLSWTEASAAASRVQLYVARTTDGGRGFSAPVAVHGAEVGRPGFTALSVASDDCLACAWLDHHGKGQQPFCSVSKPGGKLFHPEQLVYANPKGRGVCPCCDTDIIRAPEGVTIVAFRNNDNDNRDICVVRRRSDAPDFESPVTVNQDHWRFEGCPHDGPSLALQGNRLHLVWMDAHTGKRRVYYANSELDKFQFKPCLVNPQTSGEQGHPKIISAGGTLHVVWDASLSDKSAGSGQPGEGHHHHARPAEGSRVVMYTCSTDGGEQFGPARAIAQRSAAFQVNPSLAVGPSGWIYVVWNEFTAEGKSVVFARLRPTAG
jgi:hypothetical protein